jgi:hypothetical protein
MRWAAIALAATALVMLAPGARADEEDPGKLVRLTASVPGGPQTLVLDLRIRRGDSAFESNISGWAASLDEGGGYGEVTGHCVEVHCALSLHMGEGYLDLAADIGAGAPADGRFVWIKEDGADPVRGPGRLTPVTGALPGIGALSAPDAVSAMQLFDLLLWNAVTPSFASSDPKELPDAGLRESLAEWQGAKGLPPTGLITDKDLAVLRAGAEENRAALGWTPLGDKAGTWRTGYPARLLPTATTAGREQRYASADGKALMILALEPPMTEDAFDALVDKETADSDTREHVNYARSNGDFTLSYVEKGIATVAVWHLREGGMARILLRYPADQEEKYALLTSVLPATFVVSDDFKTP